MRDQQQRAVVAALADPSSDCSSRSAEGISRWLVGSSSTSTLCAPATSPGEHRAAALAARQTPQRLVLLAAAEEKRAGEIARLLLAGLGAAIEPDDHRLQVLPDRRGSCRGDRAVAGSSRCSAGCRGARLPSSASISPSRHLMSVVLPAPLGPMIPMRSPRMTVRSRLLNSTLSSYAFDTPSATTT